MKTIASLFENLDSTEIFQPQQKLFLKSTLENKTRTNLTHLNLNTTKPEGFHREPIKHSYG